MGEDRTDTHNADSLQDRLTIAQAAQLLGVHKNTVRNRIKDGTYRAEKILTERGETYFIDRKHLLQAHGNTSGNTSNTNTLSSASQQSSIPTGVEVARELLRPFIEELGTVREQLGAERARREIAENLAAALEAELEALRASQMPTEAPAGAETTPAPEGPQEAAQPPQEEAPELVALAQASSVGPSVGETVVPPEGEEAEQERVADQQLDTQEAQEDEAEAPAPPEAQNIGEAETVEHERIVLREPTRGSVFTNAEPERRSWWRRVFRG
jgi:excisionase family DNA binding protein